MSIRSPHPEPTTETDLDPRWQLVERIVSSQSFAKSARLSSFLNCVCDLARRGQFDDINEHYIGTRVFGRRPDYDPGADSIVRSHASRLRHRLNQYFAEEGAQEPWMLTIPKGSYLPVFHFRQGTEEVVTKEEIDEEESQPHLSASLPSIESPQPNSLTPEPTAVPVATQHPRSLTSPLSLALVLVSLIALALAGTMLYEHRHTLATVEAGPSKRIFWNQLFTPRDPTLVVTADSGLVMLQGITKHRITLPMYLNGTYLQTIPPSPTAAQTLNLATRRYTSVVDLSVIQKILRMPGLDLSNTRFVYSRDLRPSEMKHGNVILLGTYESTPWVQLFEPGMNFYFQNNLAGGIFSVVNRQPKTGEQPTYDSREDDPEKVVYGVVGYRPSLDGTGKVLILEGQSMAGTETASDFVFDDGYLLPFLHSIQRPDGSLPYFELLLRSRSISGESSRLEIVASRVEDH